MPNFYEELPDYAEQDVRLDRNWCEVGFSIQAGSNRVPKEVWEDLSFEFAEKRNGDSGELKAAIILTSLLGVQVRDRDKGGRQKAVDLTITYSDQRVGVVEVTSTTDVEYAQQVHRVRKLEQELGAAYKGHKLWALDLTRGWSVPKDFASFAGQLAERLHELEQSSEGCDDASVWNWVNVEENIRASIRPGKSTGIEFIGWDGRIPDRPGSRYLDRLNQFLRTSPLINDRKLPKLSEEAQLLGAVEQHLYIHVASLGQNASLLPATPAQISQGTLDAPEQLTDLWLDGNNGGIFHWNKKAGWKFHPDFDRK